ncbi:putative cystathionine gamma-synthase [Aspergillus karnatakaensis]|uniref:putative cystathionine gamma-synthase n=1 Tax=Aspergillus karnatakaensis TaxID=1810916 RepID=UPI003CCDBB49
MTLPELPPPQMQPLGTSQPPGDKHAVSVSLPTWASVPGRPLGYKWVIEKMEANYPRMGVNTIVQNLATAVLDRCISPATDRPATECMLFPSRDAARRCVAYLQEHHEGEVQTDIIYLVYSPKGGVLRTANATRGSPPWAQFHAVIYDTEAQEQANHFWSIFGDGLSTRHAEFLLTLWPDMSWIRCDARAKCNAPSAFTVAKNVTNGCPTARILDCEDQTAKAEIRNRITRLVASENPNISRPSTSDVFLYAKGMCAIAAVARALMPNAEFNNDSSGAVVFGWPYSETPKCVSQTGYDRYTFYSQGTSEALDLLEQALSSGRRIRVLFCEIPSNPLLSTPDLHRIRALASKYDFLVVCDETLGTFVNVDVLPYADIVVTSLTKIFNGAGNAMGGSAVINPHSRHYDEIHTKLSAIYEDVLFPGDAGVLAQNSRDLTERVHRCNANAFALATFLKTQPAIESVLYPPFLPTGNLYERCRRVDGGYGYVLSVIFKNSAHAVQFYDRLDMCKGPSVGTNFSLALPYSQLAHVFELDWAEEQGIPKHIVRFSVGLEREGDLIACVVKALQGLTDDQ